MPLSASLVRVDTTDADIAPRLDLAVDFVGKAKWEAWNKVKGSSKEDAHKAYVEKLKQVRPLIHSVSPPRSPVSLSPAHSLMHPCLLFALISMVQILSSAPGAEAEAYLKDLESA